MPEPDVLQEEITIVYDHIFGSLQQGHPARNLQTDSGLDRTLTSGALGLSFPVFAPPATFRRGRPTQPPKYCAASIRHSRL